MRQDSVDKPGPSKRLLNVTAWCTYASGVVSIFGIAFLFAFFVLGAPTGTYNDIAVIVQFVLMLPLVFTLYQVLRPIDPKVSLISSSFGLVGMTAVILLQLLLVTGVIPFAIQIVLVLLAFFVVLVWFVLNGRLAPFTDKLPDSMLFHVLAWLYIGYPLWAFNVGRRLQQ